METQGGDDADPIAASAPPPPEGAIGLQGAGTSLRSQPASSSGGEKQSQGAEEGAGDDHVPGDDEAATALLACFGTLGRPLAHPRELLNRLQNLEIEINAYPLNDEESREWARTMAMALRTIYSIWVNSELGRLPPAPYGE